VTRSDELEGLDAAIAAAEAALLEEAGSEELRLRWSALLELQRERASVAEAHTARRLQVFERIHESLARLRELGTVAAMVQRAPAEIARSCGFDRVAIYRIDGSMLVCEGFHVRGDPVRARELLEFSRAHPAPLQEQILETEMVRRRRPMVVHGALTHPLTYKPLVEFYDTNAYVAAPIMPEGRVIGFLHAEHGLKRPGDPLGVDDLDRDALWAFAEGFGHAVERMQLLEHLRAQGRELRELIARTDAVVAEHLAVEVDLAGGRDGSNARASARAAAALLTGRPPAPAADHGSGVEEVLTRREREVLALVAMGATNQQIAEQLVITPGTAKSHVKRILRKLGAANRVEATSLYLRSRPSR